MDRLAKKHETACGLVPEPLVEDVETEIGVLTFGSSRWAAEEARDKLGSQGIRTGYLLLRALPFTRCRRWRRNVGRSFTRCSPGARNRAMWAVLGLVRRHLRP